MNILGIGGFLGHDSNAVLLAGNKIIAGAQEERFTRIKHDKSFPRKSIEYCLSESNIDYKDITDIAFTELPRVANARSKNRLTQIIARLADNYHHLIPLLPQASPFHAEAKSLFPQARIHSVFHHYTHVLSSYILSGFDDAAFICVDGAGENYCTTIGTVSGQRELKLLDQHSFENGLGMFYTIVTKYLGFLSWGDEYKVMGLAPYGTPRYINELSALYKSDSNGCLRLKNKHSWDRLDANLELQEIFSKPMRMPSDPIESRHADIAASVQHIFNDEIIKLAKYARRLAPSIDKLIFTGGCAQNCVAGGKLAEIKTHSEVFVSPVASDMSSALGAAIYVQRTSIEDIDKNSFNTLLTGPEPGEPPTEALPYRIIPDKPLHEFIADKISKGLTVAWARGKMELGPRALGSRSIFADPRNPKGRSDLNRKIKFRESFRPFAPAVLKEKSSEWFKCNATSDYMNVAGQLKQEHRHEKKPYTLSESNKDDMDHCSIPGVVHADYSSRLQTVSRELHPDLHTLISEFDRITNTPILINTSFNLSGEPIVCTAYDAWQTFTKCDIDLLVINDDVYTNPRLEPAT